MEKLFLYALISIGFVNILQASPVKPPHSPFSVFHKKKHSGIINDHGLTRSTVPKVRSGYTINKKK